MAEAGSVKVLIPHHMDLAMSEDVLSAADRGDGARRARARAGAAPSLRPSA